MNTRLMLLIIRLAQLINTKMHLISRQSDNMPKHANKQKMKSGKVDIGPPMQATGPPWSDAGWESECWGVIGIPLPENRKVNKCSFHVFDRH